jgi:hypothetical protein
VIVLAVRWYLRFGLSYRDVGELLAGVEVMHLGLGGVVGSLLHLASFDGVAVAGLGGVVAGPRAACHRKAA